MDRVRRGWSLTKQSWAVLRSDRSLAAFPVLGGLTTIILAAAFGLPSALLFQDESNVLGTILAAVGIYVVTFAGVFFNVALAGAAVQVLDGHDATVASGVAVARRNIGAVSGWAAMVASVNIIIRALQEKAGPLGDLLLGGLAVAWGLVTFLAVPVIAIEGTGPIGTLKRSAGIFRDRWGEQVTGQFSIGAVVMLATILPAVALVGIGAAIGSAAVLATCIVLAVIVILIGAVVSTALSQIFAVALYRFAVGEGATGAFSEADLAGAVAPKGMRGGTI